MSIDSWKSFCDGVAVVAALVTFAAGAGAWISGRIINQRQESQLKKFDGDLTQARLDLAKAERSNLELKLSMQPRDLGAGRMLEMANSLRSFSGTDMPLVISWYPIDVEAAAFAKQISQSLKNAGFVPASEDPLSVQAIVMRAYPPGTMRSRFHHDRYRMVYQISKPERR